MKILVRYVSRSYRLVYDTMKKNCVTTFAKRNKLFEILKKFERPDAARTLKRFSKLQTVYYDLQRLI